MRGSGVARTSATGGSQMSSRVRDVRWGRLRFAAVVIATSVQVARNALAQVGVVAADVVHTRVAVHGGDGIPSRSRILLRLMAGEHLEHWVKPLYVQRA